MKEVASRCTIGAKREYAEQRARKVASTTGSVSLVQSEVAS